jgi:hypothetical protein
MIRYGGKADSSVKFKEKDGVVSWVVAGPIRKWGILGHRLHSAFHSSFYSVGGRFLLLQSSKNQPERLPAHFSKNAFFGGFKRNVSAIY